MATVHQRLQPEARKRAIVKSGQEAAVTTSMGIHAKKMKSLLSAWAVEKRIALSNVSSCNAYAERGNRPGRSSKLMIHGYLLTIGGGFNPCWAQLKPDSHVGACAWRILKSRERWQRDSSAQAQPMLMGMRAATWARNSTVWRPEAFESSSRSYLSSSF